MSTETGTGLIIVYGDSLESVESAISKLEKHPDCIRTAQECWFQPLEVQHPALRAYLCQNIVTFFRFSRTLPLVAVPAFWISDKELAEVRRDFPGAQILDARDVAEQGVL